MIASLVPLLGLVPSNEGQWSATSTTPLQLAQRVDAKLAGLRQTTLSFHFSIAKKELGNGYADGSATILSPTRFALLVPIVNGRRAQSIFRERWIADGKRYGHGDEFDTIVPKPISTRPAGPSDPANAWFANFSAILLSGVGRTSHPLENLVADAKTKRYTTTVQHRQFTNAGKPYTQYRLVLSKGAARYEMVVDGHYYLPTGVTNFVGTADNSRWSAVKWTFPRRPLDASVLSFRGPKELVPSTAPRPR